MEVPLICVQNIVAGGIGGAGDGMGCQPANQLNS